MQNENQTILVHGRGEYMDSILNTIKKMVLGIPINSESSEEQSAFDTDLIIHINAAFSILTQLGAGPKSGFVITDDTATWSDYCGDRIDVEMIKTYVYLKTRLGFDPPASSSAFDQMDKKAKEYEWRICEAYEHYVS